MGTLLNFFNFLISLGRNRTSLVYPTGDMTFHSRYNAANQQTSFTEDGSGYTETFAYDGNRQRVSATTPSGTACQEAITSRPALPPGNGNGERERSLTILL